MRRIAIVTTSRADYGIYRPLLKRLKADPDVDLQLVVGGMHLRPEYGNTVAEIEDDGMPIAAKLDFMDTDDSGAGVAKVMGRATVAFAEAFERIEPEIVAVLGDRYEMHAAAVAAQPFAIPIAHLHGGELTLGAMDDNLRHSITKLSHLHFVSTETYGRRVRQLGEEAWRIVVSGAMGLDALDDADIAGREELEEAVGMGFDTPPLLVTYHPATRQTGDVKTQTAGLFAALEQMGLPCVFTAPNADEGGRQLRDLIETFIAAHENARLVDNLGTRRYFGLMRIAAAMVGNSSSGIIEAASFKLPVVNIGTRQEGRVRGVNVVDTSEDQRAIASALDKVLSPAFKASLADMGNPYKGDEPAADVIHRGLMETPLDDRLIKKYFADIGDASL